MRTYESFLHNVTDFGPHLYAKRLEATNTLSLYIKKLLSALLRILESHFRPLFFFFRLYVPFQFFTSINPVEDFSLILSSFLLYRRLMLIEIDNWTFPRRPCRFRVGFGFIFCFVYNKSRYNLCRIAPSLFRSLFESVFGWSGILCLCLLNGFFSPSIG